MLKDSRPVAEGLGWQDFLAEHTLNASVVRRVRFYLTSRAAEDEIPGIRKAAEREFRLLQGIHHPGIARAVDLAEHAWGPAVIFDHQPDWVRLDQWLIERGSRLQLAQRLQLLQDLAEIIDYAHARRLAHRSLHPRAIFVDRPEAARPSLVVTDWQTGTRTAATSLTQLGSSTDPATLTMFFDDEVRRYQAPEAANMTRSLGHQLDVFSLGVLAYRIFADREAAPTPEALLAAVTVGGLHLDAAADGMPKSLVDLVYDATRGDPAQRLASVAEFRGRLEDVWEELTAPEPEPVVDPLSAHKGDVLDGGLTVVARLGSGATATALLVTRPDVDGKPLVLKVARDEQHRERFAAEAATLDKIRDWRVAALVAGPIVVGGRTALLMESAGERTLAEELRGGRLALELLERYGRDLLEIVAVLDSYGIWHRDIKPANLAARARPSDKQQHLCVFDFSLSATPADQLSAGTVTYLDPFLGPPRRLRYDAAAERFAAAVTLYEMATGTLPRWGDNANPAVISEEVSLDPTSFDPAVADRMVGFFARALARDDAGRFDTVDEMTDAWRAIFREIPDPDERSGQPGGRVEALHRGSPLEVAGLTARARSALERRGVHTVGQLLDANQSELIRARGVPDATRKEILAQARSLRAELAVIESRVAEQGGTAGSVTGDAAGTAGIEELCAALLPAETSRNRAQRTALRVLLGQATGDGDSYLHWPTQSEAAARVAGQSQPQVSNSCGPWTRRS
ncbi:protein kinase domain-containing protein [Plantactinospora sp. KLBMP9567]|uniref:protein kinase domain-containing protein n=1 Tax=Plantactinospora sp. KLBMP9567 TaxID=3085900 RepID=UPI0029826F81|nr:protein kinase [Plantactinospora sp. KLBMP9567]MDW5323931.1 protein kinase [Plantactinospora sp. KLBMP9567]